MDSFFEDRFKARETYDITRLAALQQIWGSETASSHGTTA